MNSFKYGPSVLVTKNLSLSFGDNLILRDINLNLKDIVRDTTTGQVITLLGRSGRGKTQLMKIIAGLQAPTSGEIFVGTGGDKPEAGKVGMVLQEYPLMNHRTVESNFRLVSSDKERIAFLVDNFEVGDHMKKYACQLSGGQRQRVAIIQQILSSEHFILLDEPFSGLDPVATEKLSINIRKVADLAEENTIIVSTHILEPSMAVSDTVLLLGTEPGKEGSTIVSYYDLIGMGLAWEENIRTDPRFITLCNQIRDEFHKH